MIDALLPPNATSLERATAQACAGMADLSIPLRDLWQPATCPASLLPYLAWSLSVNYWDSRWPEATKRAVIQASCLMHQRKGTLWALRQVLGPLGYRLEITEWWQHHPPERPGTFRLTLSTQQGTSELTRREIERLIDEVKPVSRHLIELSLTFDTTGVLRAGLASLHGDILTVYAYTPQTVSSEGTPTWRSAVHTIDTLHCFFLSQPRSTLGLLNWASAVHTLDILRCP